ncbi:hypothetical protein LO763_21935 [Glycomyces sp. A-F 0318]|uniref:hypothetical protein n=1 Tax=Glycomyces amatae TaxID=2881355 RepID=UPI001E5E3F25|nr:hypothetical protein [Glycomyces amatae]MCD0446277.1 hypothetical protein [Glycomyces amatae]
MTELRVFACWFPLVPRARPHCAPLDRRVEAVTTMAHQATTATEAAAALNLTALFASDISAHDLAAELCERQLHTFVNHAPLHAGHAGLAMEPVINLARLAIRAGDGDRAHQILDQALAAAADGSTTSFNGYPIDFTALADSVASRRAAHERLWTAFHSDGTRALARAGRWNEALLATERRGGIGDRLLDGRQTAIIANFMAGNLDDATALIADTEALDPWEKALAAYFAACLAYANDRANTATCVRLTDMIQRLQLPPEQQLFQVRLGLSILELTCLLHHDASALTAFLTEIAVKTGDAYAARDLLTNPVFPTLVDEQAAAGLAATLQSGGLDPREGPALQHHRLQVVADGALTRLSDLLKLEGAPHRLGAP